MPPLVRALFPDGAPRLLERQATRLGRSGVVFLPRFADALDAEPPRLLDEVVAAVRVAARAGARRVSLAGLLPSLLGYGSSVAEALSGEPDAPALTTGHAATVAAVVLTVEALLEALGRPIGAQRVAVVGFGSIGSAAVRLVVDALGAPRELIIANRAPVLAAAGARVDRLRAAGARVRLAPVEGGALPEPTFEADLILGASSTGEVLDVERLRPGTLVADDSFPPIAATAAAWRRMDERGDVLLVGAGLLDLGPRETTAAAPALAVLPAGLADRALERWGGFGVPGCRAEPLLQQAVPSLPPVLGPVEPEVALSYLRAMRSLGIRAAPLHLGERAIPEALLASLRRRREDA